MRRGLKQSDGNRQGLAHDRRRARGPYEKGTETRILAAEAPTAKCRARGPYARVLQQLRRQQAAERQASAGRRAKLAGVQEALGKQEEERARVLGLYRKGRIGEEAVERQMQEMAEEEVALRAEMAELARQLEGVDTATAQLDAAAGVLEKLEARLREPLSWELRRELIESLVEQVRVDTRQHGDHREASITVTYRFSSGSDSRALGSRSARVSPDNAPKLELRIPNRAGRRTPTKRSLTTWDSNPESFYL
jgi:hypothetical protein